MALDLKSSDSSGPLKQDEETTAWFGEVLRARTGDARHRNRRRNCNVNSPACVSNKISSWTCGCRQRLTTICSPAKAWSCVIALRSPRNNSTAWT